LPIRSSKAARYFLLQLDHPQVTFRAVIVKRHRDVRHETQDFITTALQSFDEIIGQRFLLSLLLLRGIGWLLPSVGAFARALEQKSFVG
jgi:hypothetical protein